MNTRIKKLLIVGFGDVALRAVPLLVTDWSVVVTQRRPNAELLGGVTAVDLDLDATDDLAAFDVLPQMIDAVLYTAPPPNVGESDVRLARLLAFWRLNQCAPKHFVYISTTGVYGDCAGAWVDEASQLNPQNDRAVRRVDAENRLQAFAAETGMSLTILRAPGIYALERLPLERVRRGLPVLNDDEDSFSNHIHADDLAMLCAVALNQPSGVSIYNASDDLPLKMGEWFTLLAQTAGLPEPERLSRAALELRLPPMQWSFMRESRRLSNAKIKAELGIALRYPTVLDFVSSHATEILKLA